MAVKTKGGYKCGYCGKEFTDPDECDVHKESHNLIYLAISQQDLSNLINFIYTKEESLLGEYLVDRLMKYLKGSFNISNQK